MPNSWTKFNINVKGLKIGKHKLSFVVEDSFFTNLEYSIFKAGTVEVDVEVKKTESMCLLDFDLNGFVIYPCDRCFADVRVPVESQNQLIAKLDAVKAKIEEEEDENIVHITPENNELNIAPYLYEFITLAKPLRVICDELSDQACDESITRLITQLAPKEADEDLDDLPTDDEGKQEAINPIWEKLKNLKK